MQGEGHVMAEAELSDTATGEGVPRTAGRHWEPEEKRSSAEVSEGWPCWHLIWDFRTVRQYVPVVLSHLVCPGL